MLFLTLLKHYKIGVSASFGVFLLLNEKKNGKKTIITGISGLGFLGPNMAVAWRITVFQNLVLWNPIFRVFLGCARFGRSWQKCFFYRQKTHEILIDNRKAHFLFLFLFLLFLFFGGLKGQVRWPKNPPHLALNPPYCFFFLFLFWRVGPPHLALNPPFFLLFACNSKKMFPSRKRAFLLNFQCLPFFLLSIFPPPFFSFAVSCPFLSSFLLFFLFCFILLPRFCRILSFSSFLAFVSWKEQH